MHHQHGPGRAAVDTAGRRRFRWPGPAAAALALTVVLGACTDPGTVEAAPQHGAARPSEPAGAATQSSSATTATATTATTRPAGHGPTALDLLAGLAVKGRAAKTGYRRDEFGPAWTDTDRNGCDTRNDVLRRDLRGEVLKPGTRGCVVLSGDLVPDPYTRTPIRFVRGGPSEVDIDHVVALGDAWQKGAASWVFRKRLAFANDPLNLLTVDASANRQKGDGDAATWLPPNRAYRCAYVARQVAVKAKYRLWVTAAEREAIVRVLATCPDQPAPRGGNPTYAPVVGVSSPRPATSTTTAATTSSTGGGTDPRYGTCGEAIDHGLGPYFQGRDPEYDWYQDRDHDGVVCER